MSWKKNKILITGGTGLIGTHLTKRLKSLGLDVCSVGFRRGDHKCDFRSQHQTKKIFDFFNPKVVFHLAAKVGGIYANVNNKSDFYVENTLINTNVIYEIQKRNIPYTFAMGTGCAYPKALESSNLVEETFLDGIPESTNDAYAYSKRNLLVHLNALQESQTLKYLYFIPANIYGPYDNFHLMDSHVVPGLIAKFILAIKNKSSSVIIGGNGDAKRDFLYIEDAIDAMILACDKIKTNTAVNIATNELTSIRLLADVIKSVSGFSGKIKYDKDFPEGQKQRIFDTEKIKSIGWSHKTTLEQGIRRTFEWCLANPDLVK